MRNSIEHSAIQEDCFKHCMGAVGIGCLLCTVCCFCYNDKDTWLERNECTSPLAIRSNADLLKLVSQLDSLLPEDQRTETSSEGHS